MIMKLDKTIKREMKQLQQEVNAWNSLVSSMGNQDALTDRMLENIVEHANKIGRLSEQNLQH